MNEPLHPMQASAVEKLRRLRVGALYADRQEGKMRTVAALIGDRFARGRIDRALWLCTHRREALIRGGARRYLGEYEARIRVCGLESLSHNLPLFLELAEQCEDGRVMLVIDNGLLIKNPNTLRTQRVIELSERCSYRLLISDVPLTRRASDMFSQWYALDWRILGYQTYWAFCVNHVKNGQSRGMDYLARAIAPYSAQVLREDVQSTAGRREYVWQFRLPDALMSHYRAVSERFMWKAAASNMGVYRMLLACRHVASGRRVVRDYPLETEPFYEDDACNARLSALGEVLSAFPGRRTLVLCYYRFECEAVMRYLAARYGEERVARYDAGEEAAHDYTVMNTQADEWESARLQAELIVYYSSDWNWKARHEKEKRCQSALPGGELTVVSLVAADTVEMQILRCVWQKDRLINALRRELAGRKE